MLTRRGWLAGAAATFASGARAEGTRLEAAARSQGELGYGGASPGPTLRAAFGAEIRVTLANRLAAPTALRLPGGGLESLAALAPGVSRAYKVAPSSGFDLYFPYGPPEAADQLGAGLFGAVVVEEPAAPQVDLDAAVLFSAMAGELRLNGTAAPLRLATAPGGRVRLRLANACPDALLGLRVGDPEARIVAIDGRPCPAFWPRAGEFAMCPGARFEWMFDLGAGFELTTRDGGLALRIAPEGGAAARREPFAGLPADPRLPQEIALEDARQVAVAMSGGRAQGYALNGASAGDWRTAKPLFSVARGTPVALTLSNATDEPQTLRLEGHGARLLHAFDDGWDPYWRDCLFVAPGAKLHAAFVAAARGAWPLASASPQRGARGLAGWFRVT